MLLLAGYLVCINLSKSKGGGKIRFKRYETIKGKQAALTELSVLPQILNRLVSEEGADCVVLVDEDQKGSRRNREDLINTLHDNLAIFSFGTKSISGTSLTRAGKMCPYHVMHFDSVKNTLQFLDIYQDELRFEKYFK